MHAERRHISTVSYKFPGGSVCVGSGHPIRVNVSLGVSNSEESTYSDEIRKLRALETIAKPPDFLMDLSTSAGERELWQDIRGRFNGPVGIVPHYLAFDPSKGISQVKLTDRIRVLLSGGIGFFTIHVSPTWDLAALAFQQRQIPVPSRGGAIVLRDMQINNRRKSIYEDIFDDLAVMAKDFGAVIHLGPVFRSGCLADGLDNVAKMEIHRNLVFANRAQELGAKVTFEGPGHLCLKEVSEYLDMISVLDMPLMPLGPIITDAFPDIDHTVAAMGAAYMMSQWGGGIINAITPVEHKGGVPSVDEVIGGLRTARAAAHAASLYNSGSEWEVEHEIAVEKSAKKSCTTDLEGSAYTEGGCSRCGSLCPLLLRDYLESVNNE